MKTHKDYEITFGFTASKAPLARLIRWLTKGRVSHSWMSVKMYDHHFIIHATVGGVLVESRIKWQKKHSIYKEFGVEVDITKGVKYMLSLVGEEYDYLGLFGFLKIIFWKKWFNKKVKNPWASPKALVCSEYLANSNHYGELLELKGVDPEALDPEQLLKIFEKEISVKEIKS